MKKALQFILFSLAIILPLGLFYLKPHPEKAPTAILELPPIANTPRVVASSVPSPSPSPTITTTPSPLIFRDDFNGTFAPGWMWTNEDPTAWNLIALPGFLQINLSSGSVKSGTLSNLLLRPIPAGDIQVTMGFTFRAFDNYQFAGLILYESQANFLQIGRSYCRDLSLHCVRSGIYVQRFENSLLSTPNESTFYEDFAPVYLRLTREGNTYSIYLSGDEQVWYRFAKYTLEFEPTHIGLIAGQNLGEPTSALFDFFEISRPEK